MQLEDIASCIAVGGDNECWPWRAVLGPHGYGMLWLNRGELRRKQLAHRIVFFLQHGWFPRVVMHTCDNRPCVNPNHLRAGTYAENSQDMVNKRRHSFGERRPSAKLTTEAVQDIYALWNSGWSQRDIALKHGVGEPTISTLVNRKTWTHVPSVPLRRTRCFTVDEINEVRVLYATGTVTQRALARRFKTTQSQIWRMLTGEIKLDNPRRKT